MTTKVKNELKLPTERKQTIYVKTFGTTDENNQSMDVVQLRISAENGDEVQLSELSACVVPLIICDPTQGQSIAQASLTRAHLRGLKLADYCTGADDVVLDILVGSDQCWTCSPKECYGGRMVQQQFIQNLDGFFQGHCIGLRKLNYIEVTLSQLMSSKPLLIQWTLQMRISNKDLFERCATEPMATILMRRRWRWIGHVTRQEASIAKTALHWMPEGKRKRGRLKITWRRTIEKEIKEIGKTWEGIKFMARDRQVWREHVAALHAI